MKAYVAMVTQRKEKKRKNHQSSSSYVLCITCIVVKQLTKTFCQCGQRKSSYVKREKEERKKKPLRISFLYSNSKLSTFPPSTHFNSTGPFWVVLSIPKIPEGHCFPYQISDLSFCVPPTNQIRLSESLIKFWNT